MVGSNRTAVEKLKGIGYPGPSLTIENPSAASGGGGGRRGKALLELRVSDRERERDRGCLYALGFFEGDRGREARALWAEFL